MAEEDPRAASPVAHRQGPPTAKRAQVQAKVLTATEKLLAEGSSYADLNVERITTAAGISRTAFYFYFRDKRDLLMRLAGDVTELLYAQADIWFSGEGDDPEDEIREALTRIAALYKEHGTLIRAIVEVSTYEEDIATFWRGLLNRFVEATARRIEREGQPLPSTAHATAFALTWMVERTFYQQLVQEQPLPDDEVIDAIVGIYRGTVYGARP
ncbi:MAG TPA: TetR/AcrR family transcriptional regulator [Baekduia sp.]|uniref:TetR/AcrR family transcriptional regulator n=1 Tax=Baekduia sp. TaxID=2600305 RepID=UPI002BA932FD|nr:TetR/AcrR family transcriptional regulator [Baekduia sp.]HMJ32324.1 TetR/AcrR family transcriptional regulator [Baekduia sp.]